jgi:6-phosphogluconolactonase
MLKILADAAELAREVARFTAAVGIGAVYTRRRFDLVLPGGRTPLSAYRELVSEFGHQMRLWKHTHFWWGDERCVPPGHHQSNYHGARLGLLMPLGVGESQVHRIRGEAPEPAVEAEAYAREFPEAPDLLILGIGPDGHVASLFPGSPALAETARRFVHVSESPLPPRDRITLTRPAIASAGRVLVVASGREKADAVRRAFAPDGDARETPARLVEGALWMVDREAAAGME